MFLFAENRPKEWLIMWEKRHQTIDNLSIDKVIKYNYRVLDELNYISIHKNPEQHRAFQDCIVQTISKLNKVKNMKE